MELLVPLLIYLAVPALGLAAYALLARRMAASGEPQWLQLIYFALFFCWGGALLVLLTSVFWAWSGMASLGMFFLLLIGAPALLVLALLLSGERRTSLWRAGAFWASAAFPTMWLAFLIVVLVTGA